MSPRRDMPTRESSQMMPTVTCTPWKPVATKKLDDATDEDRLTPSWVKAVNSYTWPEMNSIPSAAVARSQIRMRRWSPRWMADRASTMVSELISSANELNDVNGMSYTSIGRVPSAPRVR